MIAELLMQKIQQEEAEVVVLNEKMSLFANDHAYEIQTLRSVITSREQDVTRLCKEKAELEKQIGVSATKTQTLKLNANKMIAFLNDMSSDHADLRKQADGMKSDVALLMRYARESKEAIEADLHSFTALEQELVENKEMLRRAAEQDKVLNDELSRMAGQLAEAQREAFAERRYDELQANVSKLTDQISEQRVYLEAVIATSSDVIVEARRKDVSEFLVGLYDGNLELATALKGVQEIIEQSQSRSVEVIVIIQSVR